jgi:dihydropteroate synthase
LTRRLSEITRLRYPTLVALSNKDFIGESLGLPQQERLTATIAAGVVALLQGARIVRVHDVRSAVESARMVEAIFGWREPVEARHNVV